MSLGPQHPEADASGTGSPVDQPLLQMRGIVKTFPGVRALDGVDLTVRPGEVHCLLGQNGAGKSTLIKVLAGAHRPDEGEITWLGEPVVLGTPDAAISLGISTIYQELDLVAGLSVAENLFLGHEKSRAGLLRRKDTRRAAQGAAGASRPRGDPGGPRGRHPACVGAADREHGAGAVPRHPGDRDGRTVRGPRPAGGQDPLPGHPRPHLPGGGGRLHLPSSRGDPRGGRPRHRAQGRPHGGGRPRGEGHPHLGADPADDRSLDRVRLPAPRRRPNPRRSRCSRWRASASTRCSPT